MPHATSVQNPQDAQDDDLIRQALDPQSTLDFTRDLEPGEKAEDAVDFGDLSDDDLAEDDESSVHGPVKHTPRRGVSEENAHDGHSAALESEANHDAFDDLFGDYGPPSLEQEGIGAQSAHSIDFTVLTQLPGATNDSSPMRPVLSRPHNRPSSKEQQLQQELFALSRTGLAVVDSLPEPPANDEELLAALWPKFERGTTPNFMNLLPPKKARYVGKQVPKAPRPVNPTKVKLELAQDQEKSFKLSTGHSRHAWEDLERQGSVVIYRDGSAENESEEETDLDSLSETGEMNGVSWCDLQVLCGDWEAFNDVEHHSALWPRDDGRYIIDEESVRDGDFEVDRMVGLLPAKRRITEVSSSDILARPPVSVASLHSPEITTAHIAKRIKLDLNDLRLIVDELDTTKRLAQPARDDGHKKGFGSDLTINGLNKRYNISNDEAYDLLKENHQNKIRGMLGNLYVEHSLPALRLQWPFYKTRLEKQEARSFHRPPLRVNRHEQIFFDKPYFLKRRHSKGKDPHTLFQQSSDLALRDNSNALLLEYSEEYPTMLSNLGMGSKIVNHYRKRNSEDSTRPKMDIGELNVLLPQDRSPFSLFGHVDSGQITPAIHNAMYRAPIFKQDVRETDFLVVRSATGIHGSSWFLRNIDHLHAVGQEFPSVDVPGPHSRKVTTASKNRLRMISYRMARREKSHRISVSEVTSHFIDTTDMQNRQKMKEFMQFDKDHKEWKMRQGESIPDEEIVRTMVKPEDVCLLESMQVGQQHLQDAGFSKEDDDASEGDDAKEDENIEQQLAPWFTSRNFLNAAQGKAMLQLHGEGDPTGRGEAFSFIKTSMKGGFRAVGESIAERIDNKKMKDSGGHSYNVARQQQAYEESIRRIWDAQKQSLSLNLEQSDSDIEDDDLGEASGAYGQTRTPWSEGRNSGPRRHRDDETESQSTRWSTNSQTGKILEITRVVRDRYGNEEVARDIVRNPRVIRQYLRRRRAQEAANEDVLDIKPGDDDEENKRKEQRLKKELARLERNKDRRIARDKQKGIHTDGAADVEGSPASPSAVPAKSTGTQRKCANCGQVGHIKTNKKLCPMLNGIMKPDEGFSASAFTTGAPL